MNRAAPTPLVDERGVYARFESGDQFALDHSGELLWRRSLADDYRNFKTHHGLGASPAQSADAIYVVVDHDGPSYRASILKRSGETVWKTDRKRGLSWATPILVEHSGCELLIVSIAGSVVCYAAAGSNSGHSMDSSAIRFRRPPGPRVRAAEDRRLGCAEMLP